MDRINLVIIARPRRKKNCEYFQQMHRMRKQQFIDRLNWKNLRSRRCYELDEYDYLQCNAIYIMCIGRDNGKVYASMRLLPTTGRHLLDKFKRLKDLTGKIQDAYTWEASRMCVALDAVPKSNDRSVRSIKPPEALMAGMRDFGRNNNIKGFIGVYDKRMKRIYSKLGWEPVQLAEYYDETEKTILFAGKWFVDDNRRQKFAKEIDAIQHIVIR